MTNPRTAPWATAAMFSPLLLYVLALNPWFNPEQHDDVLYYFGAVAMLDGGGFSLGGTPITDWPPVFSALLASVFKIAGASVWAAKLVVLAFVAAAIGLSYAVARLYGLPAPRAIAAFTGLLPIGLISGAAVLSEWPYLALSLAFLWTLARLLETRAWRWALAAGALLALASLTRFVGVFLGAAIVVQAWHLVRRAGFRAVLPEGVVAVTGAVPWLLWKWRCQSAIGSGDAPSGAYDQAGYYLDRFSHIEPLQLLSKVESVLLSAGKVGDKLLGAGWPGGVLGLLVGGAFVAGMVMRLRSKGVSPVDGYVLICLLLLLGDLNKPERYFLPLAPFLIGYLFTALRPLVRPRLVPLALGGWAAWLLALNGYLLFLGNSDGSRGGFSMLASKSEEGFYRGEFRDLYLALRWAGENAPPGRLELVDHHGKYALAFAGRGFEEHEGEPVALVARTGEPRGGWRVWREFETITVFQR